MAMTDPNRTQMLQDPNKTMLGGPQMDPNKTIMGAGPAANLNLTQTIKPIQCPVCKTYNPAGMIYCVDCGLIFEKALDGDAFGAPAVQVPVLVDESGREFPIRPGENVIGREGDIQLVDGRISRRHACVTSLEGSLKIKDLGSTNGTKVNDQALASNEERSLAGGDKISIGGFGLVLQLPGGPSANSTQQFVSNKTAAMVTGPAGPTPVAAKPKVDAVAYLAGGDLMLPLKVGVNTFGRKAENDLAIADPYVSGKHGVIEVQKSNGEGSGLTFSITDIGSSNGTLLNESKLVPNMKTVITPDDVIRIGALELKIVDQEANKG